jgi:DNA-directed RNA polymerase specialized sigma subunit
MAEYPMPPLENKNQESFDRIVELSKSIIIKTNELGNTITSSGTNSAKELYKIKRELAKISHFENIEHPEIADKLYQNNELYEKLFPSLMDFNKTEKRIFALSIEDYKVKDISALMGLSSQYVHNVRSRLKKKVGFEDNITWSELKKRAMQETLPTTS